MSNSPLETASYRDHVARLQSRLNSDDALRRAVGGEFVAIGKLEYYLLRSRGLRDNHFVVDVGCGSGRLAFQLARFPGIRYIGCDIVPQLVEYAEELCERPDWKFEHTNGTTIPCDSSVADFVCFFSVFTHLSQEDIFRYFREAKRVLKPRGLLVMSFLEFRVPSHWATFIASVDHTREDHHLNQFIESESIQAWAAPAGFDVRGIYAGDTRYIPLPEEIAYENGARESGAASLGQSVAILQKREPSPTAAESGPGPIKPRESIVVEELPLAPASATTPIDSGPLRNVSARAQILPGGSATVGFMIGGNARHRMLIRAVGPSLSVFGVSQPMAAPVLAVFLGETQRAHASPGWQGSAEVAAAIVKVGAFTIASNSLDAALLVTLGPGNYTVVVKGATPADRGEVLIEVYLVS